MILVVDDNPLTADYLREVVAGRGRTVTAATSAEEAAALIDRGGWSCLLLDELLPDGSGLDLLRRARRGGLKAPAVILTGLDGQAVDRLAVAAVNEGLLPAKVRQKPVEAGELLALIEALDPKGHP